MGLDFGRRHVQTFGRHPTRTLRDLSSCKIDLTYPDSHMKTTVAANREAPGAGVPPRSVDQEMGRQLFATWGLGSLTAERIFIDSEVCPKYTSIKKNPPRERTQGDYSSVVAGHEEKRRHYRGRGAQEDLSDALSSIECELGSRMGGELGAASRRSAMISRRRMLVGFGGLAFGSPWIAILGNAGGNWRKTYSDLWIPRKLDPVECSRVAYRGYWEENGGCGFAVFKGIIGMMGAKYGAPYDTFPLWMMSYAGGGIAGWGTVCGALNCAAAAYGLFYDKREQRPLVDALFSWYEKVELPQFVPATPVVTMDVKRTVTRSVLCHAALSRWSYETGHKVNSKECRERCSRVAADVTQKAVEMLNAKIDKHDSPASLSNAQQHCSECHSKGKDADCSRSKMDCGFCHQGTLSNKFVYHPK